MTLSRITFWHELGLEELEAQRVRQEEETRRMREITSYVNRQR